MYPLRLASRYFRTIQERSTSQQSPLADLFLPVYAALFDRLCVAASTVMALKERESGGKWRSYGSHGSREAPRMKIVQNPWAFTHNGRELCKYLKTCTDFVFLLADRALGLLSPPRNGNAAPAAVALVIFANDLV